MSNKAGVVRLLHNGHTTRASFTATVLVGKYNYKMISNAVLCRRFPLGDREFVPRYIAINQEILELIDTSITAVHWQSTYMLPNFQGILFPHIVFSIEGQ